MTVWNWPGTRSARGLPNPDPLQTGHENPLGGVWGFLPPRHGVQDSYSGGESSALFRSWARLRIFAGARPADPILLSPPRVGRMARKGPPAILVFRAGAGAEFRTPDVR